MQFPITNDKIRAYENEVAHEINEIIYTRIKPYIKIEPIRILNDLQDKIKRNVRERVLSTTYYVSIGSYESVVRDFTIENIERVIKKYFTNPLIQDYFPGAEVKLLNHNIMLVWKL